MPLLLSLPPPPGLSDTNGKKPPGGKLVTGCAGRRTHAATTRTRYQWQPAELNSVLTSRGSLLHLRAYVGKREVNALADCGATESAIRTDLLTTYQLQHLLPGPQEAQLAARDLMLPLRGTIQLDVVINGRSYLGRFHVTDVLHDEILLARDWMVKHGVIVDNISDCLYIGLATERQRVFALPLPPKAKHIAHLAIREQINDHGFSTADAPKFWEIIERYQYLFDQGGKLQRAFSVQYEINLKPHQPFQIPPRGYSGANQKMMDTDVPQMLADWIIEPVSSPYSSPPLIQSKKDGSKRFSIDFRKLNELTIDSAQPLPIIHETLKDLGKARVFSTIDLKSGYWQIPLHPDSRKYTAFTIPGGGQYQFRVMPFGLKNAPSTFQNLMREVLGPYWREFAIAYLDDIIVYSANAQENLLHLSLVFEKLDFYGLTCSPKKCFFGRTSLHYLGHVVTADGNHLQPEHIRVIQEAQPPRTRNQRRSFLGTCGWLREYVPRFAEVATLSRNY